MSIDKYQSWGRLVRHERSAQNWQLTAFDNPTTSLLPFGNGKSYGDSCHNDQGLLLDNRTHSAVLAFDTVTGILRCEAGILFSEILAHILPHGWFLPITPGTQLVTLGGAIANDVHGKNHHRAGTLGCHVTQLELVRSDSGTQICSPSQNTELFATTIGGMGLTGNITWAEIKLMKIASADIDQHVVKFNKLEDYFSLAEASDRDNEYSVAWIDSLARGKGFGRGHLLNGNHADNGNFTYKSAKPLITVPFTPPFALVSGLGLKVFNQLYYHKQRSREVRNRVAYSGYFYPLDIIGDWNRLYGPKGLFQHQSVVPVDNAELTVAKLIGASQKAGQGSFLTVLKRFGNIASPGLMSFPKEGFTLTLDFPNSGPKALELMARLDQITIEAGGAVNPYKDARMSKEAFAASFPQWQELEAARDPVIISDFWRRVTL